MKMFLNIYEKLQVGLLDVKELRFMMNLKVEMLNIFTMFYKSNFTF
ncbi:hypothetical protein NIES4101_88160 [Calothrix sp. NIES-4101]|nr:hypothetical protein NIES4101_88160 [Calothrix sp. NIES-4101]